MIDTLPRTNYPMPTRAPAVPKEGLILTRGDLIKIAKAMKVMGTWSFIIGDGTCAKVSQTAQHREILRILSNA